jgi:hypothetical protein
MTGQPMPGGPSVRIPFSACIHRKINGFFRAKTTANATAFTFNRVYYKILTNRVPFAQITAQAALAAFILINNCCVPRFKIMLFFNLRLCD